MQTTNGTLRATCTYCKNKQSLSANQRSITWSKIYILYLNISNGVSRYNKFMLAKIAYKHSTLYNIIPILYSSIYTLQYTHHDTYTNMTSYTMASNIYTKYNINNFCITKVAAKIYQMQSKLYFALYGHLRIKCIKFCFKIQWSM